MSDDPASAYHEAGHIVVGVVLGLRVGSANIVPSPERAGMTHFVDDRLFDHEVEDAIGAAWGAMTWAGVLAQERAGFPDDDGSGFGYLEDRSSGAAKGSDLASLFALVEVFSGGEEDPSEGWRELAVETLDHHWPAVEAVAAQFLKTGRMSATDIAAATQLS